MPNPCNPSTTIAFYTPVEQHVSLILYDQLGREVSVIYNGRATAGKHSIPIETSQLSSGVYFYQMKTARTSATRAMLVQK